MARPRAGDWLEDEVDHWAREGVQRVVSLLEPDESVELGLQDEARLCSSRGIAFLSFPIPDRGVPVDRDHAVELARRISNSNQAVAIHCRAGIGRSSLVAALVLMQTGITSDQAFELIRAARGVAVPDTSEQREWVADSIL